MIDSTRTAETGRFGNGDSPWGPLYASSFITFGTAPNWTMH